MFNALGSLGSVADVEFVDLFAGTGALGIEALSRGAAHVIFVDRAKAAADVIRENLKTCDVAEWATVVTADAMEYVGRMEPVDVALLDPPYEFDQWVELLAAVPAEIAVIESDREIPVGSDAELLSQRRLGGTVVSMVRFPGRVARDHPPMEVET